MRRIIPFALLLVLPLRAGATDPKVNEFAPHASGVALAEVVKIEKFDGRFVDGPAGVRFFLRVVRSTGEVPEYVEVITALGGIQFPGFEFKPSGIVKANSLKKGDRRWFAFASEYDYDKYTEGVIGFWSEEDPKAEVLDAAVKVDAYRWRPQYDPKTKLSFGRLFEKDQCRFRAEKDGKVVWEHALPGTKTGIAYDWSLVDGPGGDLPVPDTRSGKYLTIELSVRLEKGNEFGLDPGPYWVSTGFDPETGKKFAAWVRWPQESNVQLVNRAYDMDTGKVTLELRFAFLKTGGKAAGAKTEDWYRKIDRTFDATGKVTKEETFRHDQDADPRWVKVKP
jgi:hypothetical protein